MARTNLLGTATTTFQKLIGNGRLLRVPPFQRDYAWQEEQWDDLWRDLTELRNRPDGRHYMGSLVLEGTDDQVSTIIDGQQRIATLSVLTLAVIAELQSLAGQGVDAADNKARADELRRDFIGRKDPSSLLEESRLSLNETDDAFYKDHLLQLSVPNSRARLPKSNQRLWQCFDYFRAKLQADPAARDGGALAALISRTVARQLLFIEITVDDDLDAFSVFETLNARGLELSATDLLKNYLFSRVKSAPDLERLKSHWRRVVGTVGQDRFPEFLRHHLQCVQREKVRSVRLFKMLRDRVRQPADVFALLRELDAVAELFAALRDPTDEFWNEHPSCRPYVRELAIFGITQTTPVVFAFWERFRPEDRARAMKLLSVWTFRRSVIAGRNPNVIEDLAQRAAGDILAGTVRGPADLFDCIKSEYVSDADFERAVSSYSFGSTAAVKKLGKYMLCRLEEDATQRQGAFESDPGTVEHVLPETPCDAWASMIEPERWDALSMRLGNLVLLESSYNREAGNRPYAEKLPIYRRSAYRSVAELISASPEAWTADSIAQRQTRMAERAVHVWRSDFA
jgi:hypothetical protein